MDLEKNSNQDDSNGEIFVAVFTARVVKRAKVMFLQACVTHSVQQRGGGGGREECNTKGVWTTPPSPPPPGPGDNTSLPSPGTR